ncbi:glucokinase regulatory protein [Klebsiella variicola]|jgi:Predicted sugar phosphate isomerase|nr:glucokinase regulatory protein [Klebsiella variicola]
MNSSLTAAMQARRHPDTTHIDRLATADMLAMLHQDDKQISEAVGACLPDIARLIDVATATMGREGAWSLSALERQAGRPSRRSATIRRKANTRWWD